MSFDIELISSEEIRQFLTDPPGTTRELNWEQVGNFHCEFMKGYPNVFKISEGLKEPLMICGGFAKCEFGTSYLYCPEKKGGGCPTADQCRGIDPKLVKCGPGEVYVLCGPNNSGCYPKGTICCNNGICRGPGPWKCKSCTTGIPDRCTHERSQCCDGGLCEWPNYYCNDINQCKPRR